VTEQLTIDFAPTEGAVTRMIGLVERRGYVLRGLAMSQDHDKAVLVVELEPRDPSRRVDVVARQLDRLIDVNSVCIASTS
jgi:acetolactate synthase II small subunit